MLDFSHFSEIITVRGLSWRKGTQYGNLIEYEPVNRIDNSNGWHEPFRILGTIGWYGPSLTTKEFLNQAVVHINKSTFGN